TPNPSVYGQPVTFTATVSVKSPGAGMPTGTVTFYEGQTALGTGTLSTTDGLTTATLQTSGLGVGGTHQITATYDGAFGFNVSSSAALTQVVNKDATTTLLNLADGIITAGQVASFSSSVTANAPGAGAPSGTVTFMDGSTVLGTGSLSAGGTSFS